jgi:hypothetical protein
VSLLILARTRARAHEFSFCSTTDSLYMVYSYLLMAPSFWTVSLVIIVAGLLPDFTLKAMQAVNIKFGRFYPGSGKRKSKITPVLSQTTYL